MLYGLPNIIMSELASELYKHPHLSKFLFYVEKEYENENLLKQKPISWSKLINKSFFCGRRIPIVLTNTGAYLSFRVYDYKPMNKRDMYYVTIDIDIITHKDCQYTIHGGRDACILAMVHEVLQNYLKHSIGKGDIINTYDIRDIDPEYQGYTVKIELEGFVPPITTYDKI